MMVVVGLSFMVVTSLLTLLGGEVIQLDPQSDHLPMGSITRCLHLPQFPLQLKDAVTQYYFVKLSLMQGLVEISNLLSV